MNPRQLALEVLDKLEKSGQYSNIAVDNAQKQQDLDGKDSRLMSTLVYGVIEKRITLDYIIDKLSSLPPSKIERTTRNILRLGLYQLICLDRIPPHAAINESVSLAAKRSRGFVNAILRGFLRQCHGGDLAVAFGFPLCAEDPLSYLSITYSYPIPLCKKLISIFGLDNTERIFKAWQTPPLMTLRVNPRKISRQQLAEKLAEADIQSSPTQNAPHGLRVVGGSPSEMGIPEGLCFVQDEASQICVEALGACPGETIIDMCACPGSKSFGAALNMDNCGRVLSFDLHQNKLSLVQKGAKTLGISMIEVGSRDGRVFDPALEDMADRIICDVPCSGFGVMAKKPEIRYKSLDDAASLPSIQYGILQTAARYVKPGGVIVYSTCTIFPEENENNVARFLEAHPHFEACDFCVGDISSQNGMLTLNPADHGTDGFFIAKLKRKEIC